MSDVQHKQLEHLAPGFTEGVDHRTPKLVEPKMDGHYWELSSDGCGGVRVISRSGTRKPVPELEMGSLGKHIGDVTLMCESDYGSNRAKPRIALEGYPSVWVFDMRSSLTKNMGLISRKKEVAKFLSDIRNDGRYRLRPLEYQTFDRTTPELLMGIMRRRVAEGEEGVVIKYPFDSVLDMETWLKRKKEVEVDMVCMGFNESDADWHAIDWDKLGMDGPPDSMVGAIIGGLYKEDGKLHPACLVGAMELDLRIDAAVNPNKFIGKVFVAKGFEWFSKTGSLRHPSFIRWRDDKPATECNMKQKPRLIL